MSEKIVSLTLFSIFLLFAMVVTSAVAQPRTAGVYVGDWFRYADITFSWNSTDPNATMPSYFEQMSEMEWVLMTILDVSGTNVTFQTLLHFKNGTEETQVSLTDVDTGEGNATMWVISADLNVNDTIYSSALFSSQWINETDLRTYLDGVRVTNQMNLTMEYDVPFYQYTSMIRYWDRSSGIIVEMATAVISQMGDDLTTMSFLIRITESNVWIVPEFPLFLILPLFMMATLAVSAYRRERVATMERH